MARTANAYNYYGSAAPKREPRREQRTGRRPDVRVIPGRNTDHKTLRPTLVTGFKALIAVVAVLLVVCGVRVWLSASTVSSLQNAEALQSAVEKAYAAGDELEIEHSVLANTSRIQSKAKALGMAAPKSRTFITVALPPAYVLNADGSVNLAETVEALQLSASGKSKSKSK